MSKPKAAAQIGLLQGKRIIRDFGVVGRMSAALSAVSGFLRDYI